VSGEHAERHRRKLYGRRKGPKLSPHKSQLFETLLPKLALDIRAGADPRSYFENVEDVWLEIGFGAGEHLLWQAQQHPHVGLIGAEPYESGVAKLLSRISLSPFEGEKVGGEGASPPIQTHQDVAPRGRGNIRVHMEDARDIIEALPDASLGRVFILFPDPWPKLRHHKRRFIQTEMLDALARVMKPGAELRFASDDAPLVECTLERVMAHPAFAWTAMRAADWRGRTTDWPPTRYEAKQLHGVPAFLRFVRR
jgi:tRNA (guanine-N7-)-methyltransferase